MTNVATCDHLRDRVPPLHVLTGLDISVAPDSAESLRNPLGFSYSGNRFTTSQMTPLKANDLNRLLPHANLENLQDYNDLPPDHPLRRAVGQARTAALHALLVAHHNIPGGMNRVRQCVQLTVAVAASPNFERLGLVGFAAQSAMREVLSQRAGPALSTFGVACLARGALVGVQAEFEIDTE